MREELECKFGLDVVDDILSENCFFIEPSISDLAAKIEVERLIDEGFPIYQFQRGYCVNKNCPSYWADNEEDDQE